MVTVPGAVGAMRQVSGGHRPATEGVVLPATLWWVWWAWWCAASCLSPAGAAGLPGEEGAGALGRVWGCRKAVAEMRQVM